MTFDYDRHSAVPHKKWTFSCVKHCDWSSECWKQNATKTHEILCFLFGFFLFFLFSTKNFLFSNFFNRIQSYYNLMFFLIYLSCQLDSSWWKKKLTFHNLQHLRYARRIKEKRSNIYIENRKKKIDTKKWNVFISKWRTPYICDVLQHFFSSDIFFLPPQKTRKISLNRLIFLTFFVTLMIFCSA